VGHLMDVNNQKETKKKKGGGGRQQKTQAARCDGDANKTHVRNGRTSTGQSKKEEAAQHDANKANP